MVLSTSLKINGTKWDWVFWCVQSGELMAVNACLSVIVCDGLSIRMETKLCLMKALMSSMSSWGMHANSATSSSPSLLWFEQVRRRQGAPFHWILQQVRAPPRRELQPNNHIFKWKCPHSDTSYYKGSVIWEIIDSLKGRSIQAQTQEKCFTKYVTYCFRHNRNNMV